MSRNIVLDRLKLAMAFIIVGLHAGFLADFTTLGQYLTVNGLFRVAVPIFLLINGFYFYPVLLKNQQGSWLKKVLVLYTFWMIFYSFFWFSIPELTFSDIAKLTVTVVTGYYHLWYLAGMLGAAIALIILRKLPQSVFLTSVVLCFICGVLIQYLGTYNTLEGTIFDKLFNFNWFHRNFIFFSYPFFCIGYLINKYSIHHRVSFKLGYILSAIGLVALLSESYLNFYQEGRNGGFDNYLSLVLVCPFIFILCLKSTSLGENRNIALYSSAIYFIHAFILSIFQQHTEFGPTALTFITILVSFVVSYFIIKANNKLKFLL